MYVPRASAGRSLTARSSLFFSVAHLFRESWVACDFRWVISVALFYALAVIAAVLTLNRYFSQTWDVMTFASAARTLASPDWLALYAQTRVEQTWPYAYPPLHAAVIAPLIAFSALAPDWLIVRLPPLLADIGVGILIYTLIARKTRQVSLARAGLAAWLLNPVTFYDTAVQGHFEAEWLFFVLLAYLFSTNRRGWVAASLALAVAFLFKQVAILFAIPFWLSLLQEGNQERITAEERGHGDTETRGHGDAETGGHGAENFSASPLLRVILSLFLFAAPIFAVSLPFLLYSGDYLYMNLQYVAEVPLQTQSWLVALAGLFGGGLWPVQHSTLIVALAAVVVSLVAVRRDWSLYRAAILIALAFFLLSQKVMGYYYVMLIPFALIELIPARRFGLLFAIVAAMAWIFLSPYFASWADPTHWPIYAALGIANSLLWFAVGVQLWRGEPSPSPSPFTPNALVLFSASLFLVAVACALAQPLVASAASPIRDPLIAAGLEPNAAIAFGVVLALAGAIYLIPLPRLKAFAPAPGFAFLLALVYLPLYFLTLTLTKESTAALELLCRSLGL